MKYDKGVFDREVKEYAGLLKGKVENKVVFLIVDINYKNAFYSLATLSRAIHNLRGDMHVAVIDQKSRTLDVIKDVWDVYRDYKNGLKTEKVIAMLDFIDAVNKRTGKKAFGEIFKEPDIILNAEKDGFRGTFNLDYKDKWHKEYRWHELIETAARIWKEGYALKEGEKVSIGFVFVPSEKDTELPLEDYLDSFSIALAFGLSAKRLKTNVALGASTDRASVLAKAVRTAELITTLRGCELDKEVDEEVFKKFKIFSELLEIEKMEFSSASIGIHAKGYYGRHFFGEEIGYPTLDKKTRWSSPGQMMLKDLYSPQTALESRDPVMRYAVTETLPIDIFIETCYMDYNKLRERSAKIKDILKKCEFVRVAGENANGYRTDFTVGLLAKDGKIKEFIASDSDVTSVIDKGHYKKTGIKAGMYANFPSGEAFITPGTMKGIMVGDVVINIDRSRVIPEKNPIVVKFNERGYEVINADPRIWDVMKKEKKEAWQKIIDYEKNKSLPKEIIEIYKKNFNKVGEFAINTNPKAKLCDYLIVNEKIARMIHVALGSGFEADRKTTYHWDIVVNSPRQKLDIYGIDKNKKQHWIIKKGEFVV